MTRMIRTKIATQSLCFARIRCRPRILDDGELHTTSVELVYLRRCDTPCHVSLVSRNQVPFGRDDRDESHFREIDNICRSVSQCAPGIDMLNPPSPQVIRSDLQPDDQRRMRRCIRRAAFTRSRGRRGTIQSPLDPDRFTTGHAVQIGGGCTKAIDLYVGHHHRAIQSSSDPADQTSDHRVINGSLLPLCSCSNTPPDYILCLAPLPLFNMG